jgi:hypothetical protein
VKPMHCSILYTCGSRSTTCKISCFRLNALTKHPSACSSPFSG